MDHRVGREAADTTKADLDKQTKSSEISGPIGHQAKPDKTTESVLLDQKKAQAAEAEMQSEREARRSMVASEILRAQQEDMTPRVVTEEQRTTVASGWGYRSGVLPSPEQCAVPRVPSSDDESIAEIAPAMHASNLPSLQCTQEGIYSEHHTTGPLSEEIDEVAEEVLPPDEQVISASFSETYRSEELDLQYTREELEAFSLTGCWNQPYGLTSWIESPMCNGSQHFVPPPVQQWFQREVQILNNDD